MAYKSLSYDEFYVAAQKLVHRLSKKVELEKYSSISLYFQFFFSTFLTTLKPF